MSDTRRELESQNTPFILVNSDFCRQTFSLFSRSPTPSPSRFHGRIPSRDPVGPYPHAQDPAQRRERRSAPNRGRRRETGTGFVLAAPETRTSLKEGRGLKHPIVTWSLSTMATANSRTRNYYVIPSAINYYYYCPEGSPEVDGGLFRCERDSPEESTTYLHSRFLRPDPSDFKFNCRRRSSLARGRRRPTRRDARRWASRRALGSLPAPDRSQSTETSVPLSSNRKSRQICRPVPIPTPTPPPLRTGGVGWGSGSGSEDSHHVRQPGARGRTQESTR